MSSSEQIKWRLQKIEDARYLSAPNITKQHITELNLTELNFIHQNKL